MDFLSWVALGAVALLVLYVGARLCTAAYFRSKHDYERGFKQ